MDPLCMLPSVSALFSPPAACSVLYFYTDSRLQITDTKVKNKNSAAISALSLDLFVMTVVMSHQSHMRPGVPTNQVTSMAVDEGIKNLKKLRNCDASQAVKVR